MSLKNTITDAMKEAMRSQDKERLVTIRMATAAIKQREVDERIELSDVQIIDILNKMIKQRHEAAKQFQQANRDDLASKELTEIGYLEVFLPKKLSEDEIDALVKQTISSVGANSIKDMSKVMEQLKNKTAGRADMAIVGAKVKALLN
jgi:uncharacterized protein YqeY